MIDVRAFGSEVFARSGTSLKEASKDSSVHPVEYMSESMLSVYNFDEVARRYFDGQPQRPGELPKSADALVKCDADSYALVEFKNGRLNGRRMHEVHQKALDSLLILGDLLKTTISWSREHLDYVLVYNEAKNATGLSEDDDPSRGVQSSRSRRDIVRATSRLGLGDRSRRSSVAEFGLGRKLRNYCFREVRTYTERDFQRELVSSWEHNATSDVVAG